MKESGRPFAEQVVLVVSDQSRGVPGDGGPEHQTCHEKEASPFGFQRDEYDITTLYKSGHEEACTCHHYNAGEEYPA